jgi:hypothetical protein
VTNSSGVGSTGLAIGVPKEKTHGIGETFGASKEIEWNPVAPGSGGTKSTPSSPSSTSIKGGMDHKKPGLATPGLMKS